MDHSVWHMNHPSAVSAYHSDMYWSKPCFFKKRDLDRTALAFAWSFLWLLAGQTKINKRKKVLPKREWMWFCVVVIVIHHHHQQEQHQQCRERAPIGNGCCRRIISQDQSGTPRKSVESAALRTCIRLFRNRSVLSTVNVNISRGELQTVQNLQTIKHWQLQHSNE